MFQNFIWNRRDCRSSGNSIRTDYFHPKLSSKITSPQNPKNYEVIQVSNITDLTQIKKLDGVNCRRLFWYASPQVSTATIPKEFIIDTSELRVIHKRSSQGPDHAKSQDYTTFVNSTAGSPPREHSMFNRFELPVARWEEVFSLSNSRQAGSYKWSFWKLQQTKINVIAIFTLEFY